jgi:hypothetical protein
MTLTDLPYDGLTDALTGLRAHVAAPVGFPGEAGYDQAAPWNLAATVEPAAVVLATSAYDIANTVRSVGLSADYVRSFELVTGAGEVLRVTPEENPDLFWGLRGGKSTLGIVTAVEIDLLPLPELYGGAIYFDGSDSAAVLRAWARWVADLPETISTSIALLQLPEMPGVPEQLAGRLTVAVRYVAVDDFDEAERRLAPLRAVATPVLDTVGVLPYVAIGAVHADPVDPMPVSEYHTLLRELTSEAVDLILGAAGPDSGSVQTIVDIRMLGGALAREGRHRSAFCHRDAAYAVTVIGVPAPPVAEAVRSQAEALVAELTPWSTGGQLPNFAPSDDAGRAARVYDGDTRHWLAALAERYDPAGVFRCGQLVRVVG